VGELVPPEFMVSFPDTFFVSHFFIYKSRPIKIKDVEK